MKPSLQRQYENDCKMGRHFTWDLGSADSSQADDGHRHSNYACTLQGVCVQKSLKRTASIIVSVTRVCGTNRIAHTSGTAGWDANADADVGSVVDLFEPDEAGFDHLQDG